MMAAGRPTVKPFLVCKTSNSGESMKKEVTDWRNGPALISAANEQFAQALRRSSAAGLRELAR